MAQALRSCSRRLASSPWLFGAPRFVPSRFSPSLARAFSTGAAATGHADAAGEETRAAVGDETRAVAGDETRAAVADESRAGASATSWEAKSADEFGVRNIYASGIPFFGERGMVMFRLCPALFKEDGGRFMTANDGSLYVVFYPKSTTELNKFDTKRSVRIRVRGVDVGSLLEIDPLTLSKPASVEGWGGAIDVRPVGDGMLTLKGVPNRKYEDTPDQVEVGISTGQFRTLQAVLTHTMPALFGWQALLDPNLVTKFMDPVLLQQQKEEKEVKSGSSFFD